MNLSKKEVAQDYIRWLSDLNKNSGELAGGKGANLGEMFNSKIPVPPAFVITTKAYWHLIESAGIKEKIEEILESIDVDETSELTEKSKQIRELIINSEIPEDLKEEIIESYENLSVDKNIMKIASKDALNILRHSHSKAFVAVRSSATTEDLADSSFAGQQETYLNIKGDTNLLEAVKKVFASLFTARAIYYRKKRGFSKEKFSLSVIVQKMINSEKSGVVFSKNPIKNNNNIVIEAVFGLGEGIVSGRIKPDKYEVSSELEIIDTKVTDKKIAITRNSNGENEQIKLTQEKSSEQVLNTAQIKEVARLSIKIEELYQKPQDIEFAVENSEIYIVQSRPITTQAKESEQGEIEGEAILEGISASPGIGSGKVKIVKEMSDLSKIQKGDVLITEMTNPDMVVSMQKSAAIITNEGGLTSHAAIVSREMGIPAVVGTGNATKILKEGDIITVDGYNGKIFKGHTESKKAEINPIVETKTKLKIILDLPQATERAEKTNASSIGLLRLEGIIASAEKHPIEYKKQKELDKYTELLENGISKISENFEEIWIRTSDIRTDEFNNLQGAPKEPEGNPMLGYHGIRFSLKNPEILKAELQAVKNCAEKSQNKKFGIMIPQVISTEEIQKTKQIIQELGMSDKIKTGIMVETPSACFIIKHLVKEGIDFVSFGTNDLTQYTLAVDRNNEKVQEIYNEMHPAILNAIKRVLRTCQEEGVETSICGQAGSKKEMVKFLVENGIDSISVNADAAAEISKYIAELESKTLQEQNTKKTFNKKQKFDKKFKHKNKPQHSHSNKENQNPEQMVKQIEQKTESEIKNQVQEIQQHPEKYKQNNEQKNNPQQKQQSSNPDNPNPNEPEPQPKPNPEPSPEEPQPPIEKKEKAPSYVEGTHETINQIQTAQSQEFALKQLFENSQQNPTTNQEQNPEQKQGKELTEEELDKVLDIY